LNLHDATLSVDRLHLVGALCVYLDWPEYSGDVVAPVPSQAPSMDAWQYYMITPDKYAGEYGESRRRLAAYCAAKLRMYL